LACFRRYDQHLSAGERATVAVLAANRSQARSIFRFISGLLTETPLLAAMVISATEEQIVLNNRVIIEIATASFRTSRGYSFAAVLADEIAFWHSDESSANPDVEIIRALRPGMSTIPGSIFTYGEFALCKARGIVQQLSPALWQRRSQGFGLESRHGGDESES
jgi:hypothetical protein